MSSSSINDCAVKALPWNLADRSAMGSVAQQDTTRARVGSAVVEALQCPIEAVLKRKGEIGQYHMNFLKTLSTQRLVRARVD